MNCEFHMVILSCVQFLFFQHTCLIHFSSSIQCFLLSWYHGTASSTHSTACWYSSVTSPTTSHTCPWMPPIQSPSNSRTMGVAAVEEVEVAAALFPFLPTLHILLLQPALVLIQTLLPVRGPQVHSNSQVHQIHSSTWPWESCQTIVFLNCHCHVANKCLTFDKHWSLRISVFQVA